MNLDLGIGLAGGIDKEGGRAAELLAAGFASVEFGTVVAVRPGRPEASAVTLAMNLGRLAAAGSRSPEATRIGVGIGRPSDASGEDLAGCWLDGLTAVAAVADYVSFNLSARANRALLDAACRPRLARAMAAVVAHRDALARGGRRLDLALKLPLGAGELPIAVAELAAAAGFERLTLVRSDEDPDFIRFAALAERLRGGPSLLAVGGIRGAGDLLAARAAGAAGVQVHRAFVEHGSACLAHLRAVVDGAVLSAAG